MNSPVHPSFTILKWGVRGSSLHRLVFMMVRVFTACFKNKFLTEAEMSDVMHLSSDFLNNCLLLHMHDFDKIPSGLASLFEI